MVLHLIELVAVFRFQQTYLERGVTAMEKDECEILYEFFFRWAQHFDEMMIIMMMKSF